MISTNESARIFQILKPSPTSPSQRLADKLQRLCLEHPRVVVQLEHLVDVFLVPKGAR